MCECVRAPECEPRGHPWGPGMVGGALCVGRVWGPHGKVPVRGFGLALPGFCSIRCSVELCGRTSPSPPLNSTLESTASNSSLGGTNETPVSSINCFSFCSTILTIKVTRCSRSPVFRLPTLLFPVLPPPPSGLRLSSVQFSSVQGNVVHVSPLLSEQPLLSLELLETPCSC